MLFLLGSLLVLGGLSDRVGRRPVLAGAPAVRTVAIGLFLVEYGPAPTRLVYAVVLGGLSMSLGPSVAATLFGMRSHVVGGLVVTLLGGVGALTALAVLRRSRAPWCPCPSPRSPTTSLPSSRSRTRA